MLRSQASLGRACRPRSVRASSSLPHQAVPQVYLNASEVAAAAGLNIYRKPIELLLQAFQKQQPQQYAAAKGRARALPGCSGQLQALRDMAGQALSAVSSSSYLTQVAAEEDDELRAAAVLEASVAARKQFYEAQRSHAMQLAEEGQGVMAAACTAAAESAFQQLLGARCSHTLEALRQSAAAAGGGVPVSEDVITQLANVTAAVPGATAAKIQAMVPSAPDYAVSAALELASITEAAYAFQGRIHKELQSRVIQERGRRDKPAALAAAAEAAEKPIIIGDMRMYYADIQLDSAAGQQQPGMSVRIGGRVDGWLEDRSAFVQVKNRQYKLFDSPRTYELVQMLAYMQCTRVHKCLLIQRHLDSSKTTEILWDAVQGVWVNLNVQGKRGELWQDCVLPGLREYAQQLQEVLRSTAAQDELLLAAYKRGLIEL